MNGIEGTPEQAKDKNKVCSNTMGSNISGGVLELDKELFEWESSHVIGDDFLVDRLHKKENVFEAVQFINVHRISYVSYDYNI